MMQQNTILYSIVIPIYNEVDNIVSLVEEIEWVMNCHSGKWELIFVNDGSTDGSQQLIEALIDIKSHIRCISFTQNYGQTSAFAAGVSRSFGKWIISLDGDGQNDPRDIPLLIQTAQGSNFEYDLVAGIRRDRRDPLHKKIIGKVANFIRSRVLQDNTQDTGCSLKMYKRESLEKIPLFKGMHRFLPALFQIEGFRTIEVAVNHRKRLRGKSKYNLFNRGFSLFSDLLAVAWMRKRRLQYEIKSELAAKDIHE
jgi:glycosyltransferase involved in cell wall biosynthesis